MEKDPVSLISFNTYQNLGSKAFWIFVSKWLETPLVFLIVAFIISVVRRTSLVPAEFQRMVAIGSVVCFVISIVVLIICVAVARFAYKSQGFCFANDALKIRKGIFTKHETAIPYSQINNVEITRTLFQQLFGVSRLTIVTSGHDDASTQTNEARAILETIDKELAIAVQEQLLRRGDIQRVVTIER
jgi:uncharacterized membrane protein YdbT with pleckstrin-like domain